MKAICLKMKFYNKSRVFVETFRPGIV